MEQPVQRRAGDRRRREQREKARRADPFRDRRAERDEPDRIDPAMRPIRVKKRIGQRCPPFRRPVAEEKPRVVEVVGVAQLKVSKGGQACTGAQLVEYVVIALVARLVCITSD